MSTIRTNRSPKRAAVVLAAALFGLVATSTGSPALAQADRPAPAPTAVAPAAGHDHAGHEHGPSEEVCSRLGEVLPENAKACTHGPDPAEPGGMISTEPETSSPVPAAKCMGDGVSAKRIEILYGYPADKANRFTSTNINAIRSKVAYAAYFLDQSTPNTGGHRLRWLCRPDLSAVSVRPVKTVGIGADGIFTFGDLRNSLNNQVSLGLGSTNFVRDDRIYLVFMDHIFDSGAYTSGGQGELYSDDRKDPAVNANNQKRRISLVAQWSGFVTLHELAHNLGAAQDSAPHSSGNGHCYDDNDVLCYNDGGSYFANGGRMVTRCTTVPYWWFDCGRDDYYNPAPAATSYLGTHWNTANSNFLNEVAG